MKNIITEVEEGSIAEEMGIETGDELIWINETPVKDVFDYRYLIKDEYLEVLIKKHGGEEWILEIEKDADEDIGLIFATGLMDNAKSCANKCVFCFIDQLPKMPPMRETLYFKDDDSRLSFLQGNYVTLTNMKDEDLDRIIFYHLSPINISVHTTNLSLRQKMLRNEKGDKILEQINKIASAGITMNYQIVLCKGLNDGDELIKTIEDLSAFHPRAKSLSVVPAGTTRYRDSLYELKQFTPKESREVIETVNKFQKRFLGEKNTRFVYCSDEFYLNGRLPIPSYNEYEDFPQIENGVGMISAMRYDFYSRQKSLITENDQGLDIDITIATGEAAYDFIYELSRWVVDNISGIRIRTEKIINNFFGGEITVSGLLTGTDIISQLKSRELGDILFLPANSLRDGTETFLDDLTAEDLRNTLSVPIEFLNDENFLSCILEAARSQTNSTGGTK